MAEAKRTLRVLLKLKEAFYEKELLFDNSFSITNLIS